MSVTEKVELYKFDEEKYLKEGEAIIAQRKEVEEIADQVFEKGFTGENGRKFGKSTGIGLYLCKKLCNKLGLGLEIQSKVNVGTKISIIFPKAENLIET